MLRTLSVFCVLLVPTLVHAQSWQALGPPGADMDLIVADPGHPDVVYASTYWHLHRSTDGGRSWTQVPLDLPNGGIQEVAVANDGTLIVNTSTALLRSTDAVVFSPVSPPTVAGWTRGFSLNVDPTDAQRMFIVGSDDRLVYRTLDGGSNWVEIDVGLPVTGGIGDGLVCAIDPNGGPDAYLMTHAQLFHSGDGGDSWTLAGDRPSTGETLRVMPGAPTHVLAGGGGGLAISIDAGGTWSTISSSGARALFVDAPHDAVYVGADGAGAHRLTQAAGAWTETDLSEGLLSRAVHGIVRSSAGVVVGLTHDGVQVRDESASPHWQSSTGFSELSPNAVVATSTGVLAGFFVSSGGLLAHDPIGWSAAADGISQPIVLALLAHEGSFYAGGVSTVFVADSTSPWHWTAVAPGVTGFVRQIVATGTGAQTKLYFATSDVGAQSGVYVWDPAQPTQPATLLANGVAGNSVRALALGGAILFAATDTDLWRITLADGSAEMITGSHAGVTALAVHGTDLFVGDGTRLQYADASSPTTWTTIDGPSATSSLTWDDTRNALLAGSVGAVWRIDADHTATAIGTGLPHRAVQELSIAPHLVYAGVSISGVYVLDDRVAPSPDAGVADAGVTSADAGSRDAAAMHDARAMGDAALASSSPSGCGCRVGVRSDASIAGWMAAMAIGAFVGRARRRRRGTRSLRTLGLLVIAISCGAGCGGGPAIASDAGSDASAIAADAGSDASHDASSTDASVIDAGTDAGPPGWEWINPLPQGNRLSGAAMSSATEGWAVGQVGTAMHLHAGSWTIVPTPADGALRSVTTVGPNEAWMVGDHVGAGVLLHWDGSAFHDFSSAAAHPLYGVWAPSSTFGIAVGYQIVVRWDGTQWSPLDLGVTVDFGEFVAVDGTSADDFWIAGNGGTSPVIVHCVSSVCSTVATPFTDAISLEVAATNDAWLTGDGAGHVAHWDGSTWTSVTTPPIATTTAGSVYAAAPNDVWLAATTGLLHYDGTSWSTASALQAGVVVGAGGGVLATANGAAYLRDATGTFVPTQVDAVHSQITAIWGVRTDDLWLGTLSGVFRWDGAHFRSVPFAALTAVRAIHGVASDDVWFVNNQRTITHWDGVAMRATTVSGSYNAVFALGPDHAIAVGYQTVAELSGASVTETAVGTSQLLGVWAASPSDIFAVGVNGSIIVHFDGHTWSAMDSGVTDQLQAVTGRSSGDVYAAGLGGRVLRLVGTTWQSIPWVFPSWFQAMAVQGSDILLAGTYPGGGECDIWRTDGTSLVEEHPAFTSSMIVSLLVLPDGETWAAGDNAVLRRRAH